MKRKTSKPDPVRSSEAVPETNRNFNWRGQWTANSGDRWQNLKVIRNRHTIRESYVLPGKLRHHLILVYKGAPSRQQTVFEGRNYNILQTKGDVAIMPAFCSMRSWYDDVEQDDIYLHLEPEFLRKAALGADLNPDNIELITTLGTRSPQIEQLANLAFDELQREDSTTGSNLYADSLANLLAVQLLREYSSLRLPAPKQSSNGLPARKLSQVLDLINSDLSEDLSLAALSETAGFSEYHFLRLFKSSTGLTPHQYILKQRIEKAGELLRNDALSVTEIAYSLGFATSAHLAHHFRRQTGITPTEMRQKF